MSLIPDRNGSVEDWDLLDSYHAAGGIVAGSISHRHRSIARNLVMESLIDLRAYDDGTPVGAALLLGIVDGLDAMNRFAETLDEAA
jgi:hypothetical protein